METQITKAMILISEIKAKIAENPNIASYELKKAIGLYEWNGPVVEVIEAFENENYHDIAEAVRAELWGR